jgi:hypothetical protein
MLVHALYVVASTYVAIKELSGRSEKRIGHEGKDAFGKAGAPARMQMKGLPSWKAIVLKREAHRTPVFFEVNETGIVRL